MPDTILNKIKRALRINNDSYDNEIQDEINACKKDLEISGIDKFLIKDDDPLIIQAIKTYVKSSFGYDNPDAERFKLSYDLLKQHLGIVYSKKESQGDNNGI